jgi:uncharacterized protein (DUF58 family)
VTVRRRRPQALALWLRDEPPAEFVTRPDEWVLRAELPPRAPWQGVYHVRPLRRGNYRFGDLNLRWPGRCVWWNASAACRPPRPSRSTPICWTCAVTTCCCSAIAWRRWVCVHTRLYGEGTEFERLREYLPDDDFRRIDWKATARRNRP